MTSPLLRQRLSTSTLLVAPGIFDMVSLRLANTFGFEALYTTGYGTVASHLGLPDAGLATYTDMVGRVKAFASQAACPLFADGDTGYGGLLNVRHTVRGYEEAGADVLFVESPESDALGGNIALVYTAVAVAIKHVEAGKLNAIAVSSRTRRRRSPSSRSSTRNSTPSSPPPRWSSGSRSSASWPRPARRSSTASR